MERTPVSRQKETKSSDKTMLNRAVRAQLYQGDVCDTAENVSYAFRSSSGDYHRISR